ncbi:recombinase family protein [Arthrobacter sp. NPDC080031]|uniref:recombinase family protein n=1 Tax=Arthrobacter sp. NPDC080031 TaxID=3155918 RepID=UPI00344E8C61
MQRQEADCRALAGERGWPVAQVYVDNDLSAYSGKPRPQYLAMLNEMKTGKIGRVITWHTDRLHRSPRELEDYIDASEAHGVTTQTVQAGELDLATPSGQAVARTLGAWARYESAHKPKRIMSKKLELAKNGKFSGGPIPFGYVRDQNDFIVVEPEQAAEVKKAIRAIINGASIGSIVRDLNERGVTTSRGGLWTSTAVRNMVVRPTYAGITVHKGQSYQSKLPAIVTEDEHRTAARIVKDPSRRSQHDSRVKHMLAGIVLCGACGAAMQTSSRPGGGPNRHYYKCPNKGGGHASQSALALEDFISAVVVTRLQDPNVLAMMGVSANAQDDMQELQQEALTLRARLDEAAEAAAVGDITMGQLTTITTRVTSRLEAVEEQMSHARGTGILAGVPATAIPEWWVAATVEKRRAVISALMTIHINPVGKSAPRVFDESRVRLEWKRA